MTFTWHYVDQYATAVKENDRKIGMTCAYLISLLKHGVYLEQFTVAIEEKDRILRMLNFNVNVQGQ